MTRRQAEILLTCVIAVRATSLIFTKFCLQEMGTFNLLFMRFLTAFVLLALAFCGRLIHIKNSTLWRGAILGGLFFAIMSCEVTAAHTTPAATISALVNTAIIMVPLMNAALHRRKPKVISLVSAVGAVCGVVLLNWTGQGLRFGSGELLSILEAFLYACGIILTDRFSHHEKDTLALGIVQVGVLGTLALLASFFWEQPHLPQSPRSWIMILVLAVVCTGFGFTLQPVAQRHTSAETAGLLCAVNPAVAAITGAAVLRESLTFRGMCGIVLILSSMLLPNLMEKRRKHTVKYKTILFDMDGTTLDTLADLTDAVNHVLTAHGFPERTQQQVKDTIGNGAAKLIAGSLPQGEDTPDFENIVAEYRAWYEANYCVKTAPYAGTAEVLRKLQSMGVKVGIVSNKNGPAVQSLGEKFFPGIPVLGEVPDLPRKPAPEMIYRMLEELGASADEAAYVGDSEVDIRTAQNCHMDFIGVSWGFRGREKLLEIAPNATVVDDWEEFLQIIG